MVANKSAALVRLHDQIAFQDKASYLQAFFPSKQQKRVLPSSLRFYKFHQDLQRVFMLPQSDTYFQHCARKRNLLYRQLNLIPKKKESVQTFLQSPLLVSRELQKSQTHTQIIQLIQDMPSCSLESLSLSISPAFDQQA